LCEHTIWKWIRHGSHPLQHYNKIILGPELAYSISAWLGDGRLSREKRGRKYNIKLAVKDYDFAEEWGRCLAKALGKSKPYMPRWDDHHERWEVRGTSSLLYNLLKKAKDDPWIVLPYLEKYPADACRGFFDAEGGVNASSNEITAYNTNLKLIQLFKKLLEKIGIECSIGEKRYDGDVFISPRTGKRYHRNKSICYRLAIHGKENILKFAEEVGFTIARKRAELGRLLEKYNKVHKNCLKKCAKLLIAANLVRLGLVRSQLEAARLLSVTQSTICFYLNRNKVRKRRMSRLLKLPEIERLSKEYFFTRSDEIINQVRKVLETIAEIYNGHETTKYS